MKVIFSFSVVVFALPLLADPTRPPATLQSLQSSVQPGASAEPKLELIMETTSGYQAMLNGRLVKAGDQLEQYKVLSISSERVVLVGDNGQLHLSINNKKIKSYEP